MSDEHAFEVVYIAGSGRSGSTLVERTLGALPGWVNVGELIDLFRQPRLLEERCGCGEPFSTCPFWAEVGSRAYGAWSPEVLETVRRLQQQVSRQRHLPALLALRRGSRSPLAQACTEYAGHYTRIAEAIVAVSGARVVVDASKWPGQALALHRGGVPVRLLHQVRDVRGVAHSWAKTDVPRPQSVAGSTMARRAPLDTAARWVALQGEIEAIKPSFGHTATLRYEDFVADAATTLATTTRALGLPPDQDALARIGAHEVDLPQSHGLAGNPSRFSVGTVVLRRDDAWQSQMSARDRRTVTLLAAPLLARYGYPLRGRAADGGAPSGRVAQVGPVPAATSASPPPDGWPTVAVVLPTRGRPELVREAVESVIDQDYAGDIELVVVHDQEDPQHALADLARPGRSVTLLTNTHALGLAGSRNTGLDHVKTEFVASCDDDDFWDREKLRLQVERMLAEPQLGVLGAGIRLLMAEDHVVDWPGDSPVVTRQQLLRKRRKELHSSTLLVRRSVFDAVGGYDEALPNSYAEDYEFLLRAVEVADVGVVNRPLASIRKYNASWFRDRAEVVSSALEYLLEQHPAITTSRRGHARVLGQVAFARSTMGQRGRAAGIAVHAISRWPVAPHALLALVHATTGVDPRVLLGSVRRLGRGIT